MTLLPERYKDSLKFAFGDSPALADELLALVLEGKKTATCAAVRDYVEDSTEKPVVGRRDVVLDGAGNPAAVIETVEISYRRFNEVDADFAREEGEGAATLEQWRHDHQNYFSRNGGFSPDMELLLERFRLVEILKR
ncbi:ASCH domain-containing protein [Phyllobacterium sp. YR531]|uniref:ASCH domain-containing protein n=1 Tax=Phyllobacterium sp. YR531 TaxID=1144343 RepID=UPI00026F49E7|nr:ASCH domain-containing protein [Phyllobacterium sp. YR531]EJM99947.1 hypothetical protein PMI41_03841 [Phyllobacterium sp. YR531]